MPKASITFWFDIASPYTALSLCRIQPLAEARGVTVDYKPFLLGIILRERGWDGPPGKASEAKWRYMWRDLERRGAEEGWSFTKPSTFPRNPILADRIALVAKRDGWLETYLPGVAKAFFSEDMDISDPEAMATLLSGLNQDAEAVLADAGDDAIKRQLKDNTEAALRANLFGAPTFAVGEELFWGDDRLETALDWAHRG